MVNSRFKKAVLTTALTAGIVGAAVWMDKSYSEPIKKEVETVELLSLTCATAASVLLGSKVKKDKIDYAAMSSAQAASAFMLFQNGTVSPNHIVATAEYSCAIVMGALALANINKGIKTAREEQIATKKINEYLAGGHSAGGSTKQN